MRVLTGIQPTGRLHLGNYYGVVKTILAAQDAGDEVWLFIADLHALTTIHDGERLRQNCDHLALDLLALGIDPEKTLLFRQSALPEIPLLMWILSTLAPLGSLERAHSYKDKRQQGIKPALGLLAYPALMAADLAMYDADWVPVGQDQAQHFEIAQKLITRFNSTFVQGYDPADPKGLKTGTPGLLHLPEANISPNHAWVPGIDGRKMSKTYGNTLEVLAEPRTLKPRIMSMKTDSTPVDAPKTLPSPLLDLLRLLSSREEAQEHMQSWQNGGLGYGYYKERLYERFLETFQDARQRRERLSRHPSHINALLRRSSTVVRESCRPRWEQVCHAVGLAPAIS